MAHSVSALPKWQTQKIQSSGRSTKVK